MSSNTQIADIYNDSVMKVRIPFLNYRGGSDPRGSTGGSDAEQYRRTDFRYCHRGQQYG